MMRSQLTAKNIRFAKRQVHASGKATQISLKGKGYSFTPSIYNQLWHIARVYSSQRLTSDDICSYP
jgi:hypothetical protein